MFKVDILGPSRVEYLASARHARVTLGLIKSFDSASMPCYHLHLTIIRSPVPYISFPLTVMHSCISVLPSIAGRLLHLLEL